jgi:hypothetical protein
MDSFIFKNTEVGQNLGNIFPNNGLCSDFDKKMGLATFWAIFSQTRLEPML